MKGSGMFMKLSNLGIVVAAAVCILGSGAYANGPNFAGGEKFASSSLNGWTTLGGAQWKVENGEIVGTPTQDAGGWLLLNKSYSNLAVYANLQCSEGCKPGLLLRAEKTPEGMKGI